MTLAHAIRELRSDRSQEKFAHEIGVTRLSVANWESGSSIPGTESLRALVRVGLDPAYLLGDAVAGNTGDGAAA
jgi:DNA-binding transcriptional regulator YiaG